MQYRTAQGVILKSLLYQEKERILTVYTKEIGLANFIVKGLSSKKPHLFALTEPLTYVEIQFTDKNPDWLLFKEASLLDPFLEIRHSLEGIQNASLIAKVILETFLPKSASPKVFDLLVKALKKLSSPHLCSLITSHFLLKILSYEGLIHPQLSSEKMGFMPFSQGEFALAEKLLLSTRYSDFSSCALTEGFLEKVLQFFYEKMEKVQK